MFPVQAISDLIKEMRSGPPAEIASELKRYYQAASNFRQSLPALGGELDDLILPDL